MVDKGSTVRFDENMKLKARWFSLSRDGVLRRSAVPAVMPCQEDYDFTCAHLKADSPTPCQQYVRVVWKLRLWNFTDLSDVLDATVRQL